MKFHLLALLLCGHISANIGHPDIEEGHIGVRIANNGHINYVHPDSPAQKAGLVVGDKVVAVDGDKGRLKQIVGEPGTAVTLDYLHNGYMQQVTIIRMDHREIKE